MTTNISLDAILANFDRRGVKYKFYKSKADALTHNRNGAGANTNATPGGFGPLYGFVVHNYGSDGTDVNSNAYLYRGDGPNSSKPGPLAQFSLDDTGMVWIIGWGACTHTGPGDKRVADLVKRDAMPLTSDFKPNGNKDSGPVNPFFLGCEMLYGGKGPTAAQRAAIIPLIAACMEVLGKGYTGGSVAMHREFSTSRSDPQFFKGYEIRKAVNAQLTKWQSVVEKPSTPTVKDDFDMTPAERAALITDISNAVWARPPWGGKEGIPGSSAGNNLGWTSRFSEQSVGLLKDVLPRLSAIEAALKADNVDIEAYKAAAKEAFEAALKTTLEVSVSEKPAGV